jgi:hypothetical protein
MPAENVASFPHRKPPAKRRRQAKTVMEDLTSPHAVRAIELGRISLFLTEPIAIKPGAFLAHTPWPRDKLRAGLKAALPWLHELEALLNDD